MLAGRPSGFAARLRFETTGSLVNFQELDLSKSPLNRREDWASLRIPGAFEKGLVSVIVPTYNRAPLIADAIDSVLDQTYPKIELLIVDDGSKDNTAEAVRAKLGSAARGGDFSASYIRQPNRGASAARNQGLLHSRGEFIQYLDSDDVLIRRKIERHVAALADESLDVVWSKWLVLPSEQLKSQLGEINQNQAAGKPEHQPTAEILPWEPWPTLTRRRFVAGHPLWNEYVSRWDDWEYVLRQWPRNPRGAVAAGIGCIQRDHDQGRRQDFDYNPKGVEVGLTACREASKACSNGGPKNSQIRQFVSERCWETGLEALHRGTREQALEGFGSAMKLSTRPAFRAKATAAWLATRISGRDITKLLLSKYLVHMRDGTVTQA
jgi:glycosyltransferase involved in cell wall biosynthesis